MSYNKQVDKDHYQETYDYRGRFVSYHNQQSLIRRALQSLTKSKTTRARLLEVGAGNNLLKKYLSDECDYKTLDIADDLSPDYLGSVVDASKIVGKKSFDIVCCFEVLEHLKYSDSVAAMSELSKIAKKYVIISIPQAYLYVSFWSKITLTKPRGFILQIPFPRTHKFDGEHYWELGARHYSKKRIRQDLNRFFTVEDEFTDPLNPYHHFYFCKVR